jgi:hypothetical protein
LVPLPAVTVRELGVAEIEKFGDCEPADNETASTTTPALLGSVKVLTVLAGLRLNE